MKETGEKNPKHLEPIEQLQRALLIAGAIGVAANLTSMYLIRFGPTLQLLVDIIH